MKELVTVGIRRPGGDLTMAKPVFLVADTATGLIGSYLPQQVFDDLLAVGRVPVERLQALAAGLGREPGFLSPSRLAELVRDFVPDQEMARAVRNTVLGVRPGHVESVVQDLRAIRETSPRNGELLSTELLSCIEVNLGVLVREYPSLERHRKAGRLTEATGCQLDEVSLICDLRPIYDESRRVIEGFLSHTVLRLDFFGLSGARQAVEVQLSEPQLRELLAEAEKATRKLETLRSVVESRLPGEWVTVE